MTRCRKEGKEGENKTRRGTVTRERGTVRGKNGLQKVKETGVNLGRKGRKNGEKR